MTGGAGLLGSFVTALLKERGARDIYIPLIEDYNLGSGSGNYTKDEIVNLVLKRMPETVVEHKDLTFGGDMRDITVSFEKVKRELGFETPLGVDDGIRELVYALKNGVIRNPHDERYRIAQFIVQ